MTAGQPIPEQPVRPRHGETGFNPVMLATVLRERLANASRQQLADVVFALLDLMDTKAITTMFGGYMSEARVGGVNDLLDLIADLILDPTETFDDIRPEGWDYPQTVAAIQRRIFNGE